MGNKSSKNKDAVHGYFRYIEKSFKLIIPKNIKNIIIIFVKSYRVYGIGAFDQWQVGK